MNRKRKIVAMIAMMLTTGVICMLIESTRAVPVSGERVTHLPILMYHQLSDKSSQWNAYVLSPQTFEQDILTLRSQGYTPVSASQVWHYANGEGALPDKPVMITFDDADSSFYRLAYPIIQAMEVPVLLSPVGKWVQRATDKGDVMYMTLEQIREVSASGLVEVGNHTYDMHKDGPGRRGVLIKAGEDMAAYRQALSQDAQKAQQLWEGLGIAQMVFTYPYGFLDERSEAVVKELGFTMSLSCYERINRITDVQSLFVLGRFNRASGPVSDAVVSKLDRLMEIAQASQ